MYGSFYGWYLKCQSETQTLAVIPAFHQTGKKRTCSIQIITDDNAWAISFSADACRWSKRDISIGENRFSEEGILSFSERKEYPLFF